MEPFLSLRRFFDPATLARGVSYARQGRVVALSTHEARGILEARVSGAGRRVHDLRLRLSLARDGRFTRIDGQCSCPVGIRCKHMVAALVTARSRGADEEAGRRDTAREAAASLPAPVLRWLDAVASSARAPASPTEDYPPTVRDRLRDGTGRR